jgi:hypothetical protein
MLSIATVPMLMLILTVNAEDAEVVSSKLCSAQDYDGTARECAAGKALDGSNVSVAEGSAITLLSTIKADSDKEITHVWIAEGKKGGKVSVYEAATKTTRDADQAELDWLKERKIEGAQVIVKLPVVKSAAYRTRSAKSFGPKTAGTWKVQIYDAKTTPLKEFSFTVTPAK